MILYCNSLQALHNQVHGPSFERPKLATFTVSHFCSQLLIQQDVGSFDITMYDGWVDILVEIYVKPLADPKAACAR
jgi:hypothetical protein